MAAAVVELDPLADPVGAPAQNQHLALRVRRALVLAVIGGVHVRGVGLKLGGAGVHTLHDRRAPGRLPDPPDLELLEARQPTDLGVAEAAGLDLPPVACGEVAQAPLGLHKVADVLEAPELGNEPRVHLSEADDLLGGETGVHGIPHGDQPVWVWSPQVVPELLVCRKVSPLWRGPAIQADLQGPQGLLEGLLEGPADGHGLAHGLHLGGQHRGRPWELLKGEPRDLCHDVVDGGLEARRGLLRDVVRDAVQRVPDCQLGGHLGDREPGGLRRQRAAAAHARIHLDHHDLPIGGVHPELDVGTPALHAHLSDDCHAGVPKPLVLLIGQGLRGGHGDAVPGVDTHRVDVLDGADDDDVVLKVAHDLQLVFLPADQGLLDQDLARHRRSEPGLDDLVELLHVVRDTSSRAPQSERGPDDDGKVSDLPLDGVGLFHVLGRARGRGVQPDPVHGLLEQKAVLGDVNGVKLCANELDSKLLQIPPLGEGLGEVQGGLAAHGGQKGVGPLLLKDLPHGVRGHGSNVRPVRGSGVGHDGRRV
mmetsp:Transcript_1346/g.4699  ORF Transcript_1346/g.4699 Transcript_1346/m.4699 type:complete len:535 (+) Transcript_1346:2884-4488(+)